MSLQDALEFQHHCALHLIVAVAWLPLPMTVFEFVKPSHRHQWRRLLFNLACPAGFPVSVLSLDRVSR